MQHWDWFEGVVIPEAPSDEDGDYATATALATTSNAREVGIHTTLAHTTQTVLGRLRHMFMGPSSSSPDA